MLYVQFDDVGVPYIIDSTRSPGMNVVGTMPVGSGLVGPGGGVTNQSGLNQQANALLELANLHNTLLVTGMLVASGTGNDPSAQLPTTVIQRPWLTMPDGGVPFDPQASVALGLSGTSAVVVTLLVPDGYDGVINAYSWNFSGGGFIQGSGDLQAQMLRNGAAVRNYDNILIEKGTIQIPRPISPLRIYSGQVISLIVNHLANDLLNGNVIAGFSGYFYPAMS